MRQVGLILQARMSSTRLLGKSMMPLAGQPLVARILERLKRVRGIHHLILAIPNTPTDDPLEKLGKDLEVDVFRGSESNLLERYYEAAKKFNLDTVLRVPADNVASEPIEIEKIIKFYLSNSYDFCSNLSQVFDNGYPDGIGAEVFSFNLLEKFANEQTDQEKMEHIHLNFFNYKTQQPGPGIRVGTIECSDDIRRPDIVLDVNTLEQYELMNSMYQDLYPLNSIFGIRDIIKWWDKNEKVS